MKTVLTLLIVAVLASTSLAQDEPAVKKKKAPKTAVEKVTKMLSSVTMTEEQTTGFTAAKEKLTAKMEELKTEGLTVELKKKRLDLMKAARESGLKGKELAAATMDGLSEEEKELFKGLDTANKEFAKSVTSMLTEDQMSELPAKSKKMLTAMARDKGGKGAKGEAGGKKKKGKKKKAKEGDSEDNEMDDDDGEMEGN